MSFQTPHKQRAAWYIPFVIYIAANIVLLTQDKSGQVDKLNYTNIIKPYIH